MEVGGVLALLERVFLFHSIFANFFGSSFSDQLPKNSIPLRYDLWLKTDIGRGNYDFSGKVKIHVKIIESTQRIVLNHSNTTVTNIDLLDVDENLIQSKLKFARKENLEFLIIILPKTMNENEEIILEIDYDGKIPEVNYENSDFIGLFRAKNLNNVTNQDWIAATDFQMNKARQVFPCFDEPQFHAAIGLEIQHDKSFNAISNMPIVSREKVSGTDYVTSKFQDTPAIPTYLLGFVITNFKFISNNDTKVEQRIYIQEYENSNKIHHDAINFVGQILRKFEEHFGSDYPYKKIDHVEFWNSHYKHMNNFGIIPHEAYTLSHFYMTDVVAMERISHKITFQFFQHVIALKWWIGSYLSKDLVTVYEHYIPSLVLPEKSILGEFYYGHIVFPMRSEINYKKYGGREKISNKSPAFLWMFHGAFTAKTFAKGVRIYMNAMKSSVATPEDFYSAFQEAFGQDYPKIRIDFASAMKSWTEQNGFPNIHVTKSGNKFILTQKRFDQDSGEIYTIPLLYATKSDPYDEDEPAKFWMKTKMKEIEVEPGDDWILLNPGLSGYYKVSYDESIWKALANQLMVDYKKIPETYRRQLVEEIIELARDKKLDAVSALKSLSFLKNETDHGIWTKAKDTIEYFDQRLFGTSAYAKYQKFIQTLAKPQQNRLGFDEESRDNKWFRRDILDLSCKMNDEDCLKNDLKKIENFLESGNGSFSRCGGLKLANASLHSAFIKKLCDSEYKFQNDLDQQIGCSLDRDIICNDLELILNTDVSENTRLEVFKGIFTRNQASLEIGLEFVLKNFDKVIRL